MTPKIAALIAQNCIGEESALQGYYQLIDALNHSDLPEADRKALVGEIEEIISDELNHSQKLTKFMIKYGGVNPATD